MEKITFIVITVILTSVIVEDSTGKITAILHGGRIREVRVTRRSGKHAQVRKLNSSKISRKRQRHHQVKRKDKRMVSGTLEMFL